MSKLEIPHDFFCRIWIDCQAIGFCDIPNEDFILRFCVCRRTIQRWIKHLEKQGFINVQIDRTIWQTKRIITLANNSEML